MNMLDEIRRERACELFGEGFRSDDLKRWGIAHINLRGQKLGRHILGTAYETEKANDATYFGEPCYYPENIRCSTASIKEAAPMIPTMDVPLLHWQATCFSASAIICLPFLWYRFV